MMFKEVYSLPRLLDQVTGHSGGRSDNSQPSTQPNNLHHSRDCKIRPGQHSAPELSRAANIFMSAPIRGYLSFHYHASRLCKLKGKIFPSCLSLSFHFRFFFFMSFVLLYPGSIKSFRPLFAALYRETNKFRSADQMQTYLPV